MLLDRLIGTPVDVVITPFPAEVKVPPLLAIKALLLPLFIDRPEVPLKAKFTPELFEKLVAWFVDTIFVPAVFTVKLPLAKPCTCKTGLEVLAEEFNLPKVTFNAPAPPPFKLTRPPVPDTSTLDIVKVPLDDNP